MSQSDAIRWLTLMESDNSDTAAKLQQRVRDAVQVGQFLPSPDQDAL